ncbi:MAG TPA: RelA/SpoT domain-containing protein [Tepidiformaceae bacterium]|nr:RelA/SpoT domain-containing protein [Tepidiformaceae bacterium]
MSDWTSSQADSAGKRLRDGRATEADEAFFRQFLAAHDEVLAAVVERLRRLTAPDGSRVEPAQRVKTRETLLEKLHRGSALSRVQDVAGARIAVDGTLDEQDAMAAAVVEILGGSVRTLDRRVEPNHGYRALHLVAKVDGCWVEVQVRTKLQHLWAETYERLADKLGREIRYSESEEPRVTEMYALSDRIGAIEAWRVVLSELKRRVSRLGMAIASMDATPERDTAMHHVADVQRELDQDLAELEAEAAAVADRLVELYAILTTP